MSVVQTVYAGTEPCAIMRCTENHYTRPITAQWLTDQYQNIDQQQRRTLRLRPISIQK
jgi:hypothetical protein